MSWRKRYKAAIKKRKGVSNAVRVAEFDFGMFIQPAILQCKINSMLAWYRCEQDRKRAERDRSHYLAAVARQQQPGGIFGIA